MSKSTSIGIVIGNASTIDPATNYNYLLDQLTHFEGVDLVLTGELFLARDKSMYTSKSFWWHLETVVEQIRLLAKDFSVAICVGYPCKGSSGITIRQSMFCPDGEAYHYDKVHLGSREEMIYVAGEVIDVTTYKGVTYGLQVCIDTHIGEMSTLQKMKGAEVILAPFNTPYDVNKRMANWKKYLPSRAYEYNLCIVSTNTEGAALVIDGYGHILAESVEEHGAIQVNIDGQAHYNRRVDYMSYRRPNLYKL